MPTLQELRKSKADKVAAIKTAVDDVEKFEALNTEIDALDEAIKAGVAEELNSKHRREKVAAWDKELQALQPRKASPNPIVDNLAPEEKSPRVTAIDSRTSARLHRLNDGIARAEKLHGQPFYFLREMADNFKPGPFKSFGEQLSAIAAADSNRGVDPRLMQVESLAPLGAHEQDGAAGGWLPQTDFIAELLVQTYQVANLWPKAKHIAVSGTSNGIRMNGVNETSRATGSRWGGVQLYWASEAGTATAKKPAFRQIKMDLEKLIGLFYATDELLADSNQIQSVAMQAFSEEYAFVLDDMVYRGLGTGQPLGFLNSAVKVEVAKETGQAADTVVKENIDKMYARFWGGTGAVWLYNRELWPQFGNMSMAVGTGGVPVFLPPTGISGAPYATLYGLPMLPMEQASAPGDVGDLSLVDPTQYLTIDKGAMETASSMHVAFLTGEQCFRFTYRCNGQPTWNAAKTPYKGSLTLSPFVTLAAR